ncbi:MAG: BlaI/MecI/CopY family transcriptional regulator [Salibacteraceae bacterium]
MNSTRELTRAEEQIMHILWKLEKGFVKDILAEMPNPKPAYNTVSTIVRILAEKGFVSHEAFGKTHRYYPVVSKEQYRKQQAGSLIENYYNGSVKELVSYFVNDKKLDVSDLDEILTSLKDKKK